MIYGLRKTLTSLLILLQLVAPLIHGHALATELHQGLHVPGLEFVSHPPAVYTQANNLLHNCDGLVVGISSGMKQNDFPELPAKNSYSKAVIDYCLKDPYYGVFDFSPRHIILLFSQQSNYSSPPRAPPV